MLEVVWYFRNDRQECKTDSVADFAARMQKAFDQQETENRECKPPEVAHKAVQRQLVRADLEQYYALVNEVNADVVDEHRNHGDQLEHASAEHPETVGNEVLPYHSPNSL